MKFHRFYSLHWYFCGFSFLALYTTPDWPCTLAHFLSGCCVYSLFSLYSPPVASIKMLSVKMCIYIQVQHIFGQSQTKLIIRYAVYLFCPCVHIANILSVDRDSKLVIEHYTFIYPFISVSISTSSFHRAFAFTTQSDHSVLFI